MSPLDIFLIIYLSCSSYHLNDDSHNKLEEFFIGLKQQKKFKVYISIKMGRRILFVSFLITLVCFSSKLLIGVLSVIQIFYLIYLAFLRPFEKVKGNIIEIVNECYFLLLLSSLYFLNTESDWTSIIISAYLWIISSNSMVIFYDYNW